MEVQLSPERNLRELRKKPSSLKLCHRKVKPIIFVKEGEKRPERHHNNCNQYYLNTAQDWEVRVENLDGRLRIYESTRQLGIIELTVPNKS